jgi:hypothetical protein
MAPVFVFPSEAPVALNRATYLEHVRRILINLVTMAPEQAQGPLITALMSYRTNGTLGTQAERTEASQIVANMFWQNALGHPYNEHAMRHWIMLYGGPEGVSLPNLAEPGS